MTVANVGSAYATTAALTQKSWDNKLNKEASTNDIFSDLTGVYSDEKKTIPDAVCMKVKGAPGKMTHQIGLLTNLSGSGVYGNARSMVGNEEAQATKELLIQANFWGHAVSTRQYGMDKLKQDPYAIYKAAQPQLSKWHKEMRGAKQRQALNEKFSAEQTSATASGGLALTRAIHPNMWMPGPGAVTYDSTEADYISNIIASGATCTDLDVEKLQDLEAYVTATKNIEPITLNGEDMYILTVPTYQKPNLMAPGTGNYWELLKDGDVRGANNKAIRNVLGTYGKFIMVADPRASVMTASGSVCTFGYKLAGASNPTRTSATGVYDVGYVLGKGALADYVLEELMFKDEVQAYGQEKGLGAFNTRGYTRIDFDDPTPGDATLINQSSVMVPMAVVSA